MKHFLYLTFVLFAGALPAIAQSSAQIKNDTTEKAKISLSLATIYASDASYYGQASTERLPYVMASASLNFPSGFFLSAGSYKLLNYGSGVSGVDLSAGFDFKLSKNLSSSLSYTRSFFPDSSLLLQSTNLNMASASLSYDWHFLSTGLYADYAIGDQSALYMSFDVTKAFDFGSLFSSKDYISFEPAFELVGGTQSIITTEEVPPAKGNGNGGGGIVPILLPRKNNRPPQYRTVEETSFDLLSYNLKLPLAYNRASYAVELTYQGSVLSNRVEGASSKPRSFMYLGFYYIF